MNQPPTLADLAAATRKRDKAATVLKGEVETVTALVVELLKNGERPTAVASNAGWTAAYVRKIARDHGIEPDPRYAERAARIRRPE